MNENRKGYRAVRRIKKPKPSYGSKKHKIKKRKGYVGELEQKLENALIENSKKHNKNEVSINNKPIHEDHNNFIEIQKNKQYQSLSQLDDFLFETERTYEDKLFGMLKRILK